MNSPKIEWTKDGSNTLVHSTYHAHYHSTAGAILESDFVYVNSGLDFFVKSNNAKSVSVLELGFGTGLNAINSYRYALNNEIQIDYTGIEKYPVYLKIVKQLNFLEFLSFENKEEVFLAMHKAPENEVIKLSNYFSLQKKYLDFLKLDGEELYDVIYFDAFAPNDQPELWTEFLFSILFKSLKANGVLVTYCAQGHARRAMNAVGFTAKRIPGPPSKRHITRAIKH